MTPPTRAVRFHGPHQLMLEEIQLGPVRIDEVVVEPLAVGICGTDVHIVEGHFPANAPVTLGHEICGTVVQVGEAVSNARVGDLVTIEPHVYCTQCTYCVTGREHLCVDKKAFGVHLDGGLAERVKVPARTVYQLPASLDPRVGCLAEPLACAVHALDRLQLAFAATVLVIGAGPAGLIMTKLLNRRGASAVDVVDLRTERLALAEELGASRTYNASDEDWESKAMQASAGYEYVVEASGRPEGLESALRLVDRGGTVLVFGVAPPDARVAVSPYEVFSKELTIAGSVINPYTHERAVRMLPSLGLDVFDFVTFGLDEVDRALEAHQTGTATKVIVTPSRRI